MCGVSVIAPVESVQTVSEVTARLFDRADLPERVALLEPVASQRLAKGDVFAWDAHYRAYRLDGRRDLCVSAWYVRQNFFRLFTIAPPRADQMEMFG